MSLIEKWKKDMSAWTYWNEKKQDVVLDDRMTNLIESDLRKAIGETFRQPPPKMKCSNEGYWKLYKFMLKEFEDRLNKKIFGSETKNYVDLSKCPECYGGLENACICPEKPKGE